ncbi:MAG: hypothetical protein EOO80_16010 [Oxalobacteraceae bacterium]|nr:MAG: hypothetical protein EOO80_16010 [Oxalobacteraceae bacterium]
MALSLCVALTPACATSRMGDADLRLQAGQPCFTLTPKESERAPSVRLQAVMVTDASSTPVSKVWSVLLDSSTLPTLSPATCVSYGFAPEGAKSVPVKAPELQSGRVYQVHLNTRSSDSSDPTRGYSARFCLLPDASGGRRLVPVVYDTPAWRTGSCE